MKMVITLLVALVFSLAVIAQDQSSQSSQSSQGSQSSQSTQAAPGSAASSTSPSQSSKMTGKVSSDAKSFTDDSTGKSYTVSNPDALKNYQGQHVVVMGRTDPDTGALTISSVQPPQ